MHVNKSRESSCSRLKDEKRWKMPKMSVDAAHEPPVAKKVQFLSKKFKFLLNRKFD
jgi:hypothetical protein